MLWSDFAIVESDLNSMMARGNQQFGLFACGVFRGERGNLVVRRDDCILCICRGARRYLPLLINLQYSWKLGLTVSGHITYGCAHASVIQSC